MGISQIWGSVSSLDVNLRVRTQESRPLAVTVVEKGLLQRESYIPRRVALPTLRRALYTLPCWSNPSRQIFQIAQISQISQISRFPCAVF